jgi:hypothetical protein
MKGYASLPLVACALGLLSACGIADPHSPYAPGFMRQAEPPPPPPESAPDVKELVRSGGMALFTSHPSVVAISPPRRNPSGNGWTACVKAAVQAAMSNRTEPVTLVVSIERGRLWDRRRATPEDACEALPYERVEMPPQPPASPAAEAPKTDRRAKQP